VSDRVFIHSPKSVRNLISPVIASIFHPSQLMDNSYARTPRRAYLWTNRNRQSLPFLTATFSNLRIRCMAHLVPEQAVYRYEAGPSQTTVDVVKSLHTNIRAALGSSYETFLQGSYKNDTATGDLDVDIVAIRKETISSVFNGITPTNPVSWDTIFGEVQQRLEASHLKGKITRGDKCIKVATGFTADLVPAVAIKDINSDPIAIYSRKLRQERKNCPRMHYDNGIAKHKATLQRYKPTVRMFKNWAARRFSNDDGIAPSFYLECLIYNFVDAAFLPDPLERFAHIASAIVGLDYPKQRVLSVAQDKDILVESEWPKSKFQELQLHLAASLADVNAAARAHTSGEALRLWRRAFNE
jgi:hypothetical protein